MLKSFAWQWEAVRRCQKKSEAATANALKRHDGPSPASKLLLLGLLNLKGVAFLLSSVVNHYHLENVFIVTFPNYPKQIK